VAVQLNIVGNFDDKELKRAEQALTRLRNQANESGGKMAAAFSQAGDKIGGIGRTLTTSLTLPLVGAGVVATKWASDAAEAANKVNVVFGQSAVFIEHWANSAAKAFGLSKGQALDSFGSIGTMLKGFSIDASQLPTISNDLMTLAADLGSFHNLNTAEVLDMISASFRGEFDSVQRVIPAINAAAVETEALTQTGKKNAKQLTAQEKALATYSLLMKGAGPATGDFARTQDGAANSTKIATAQIRTAGETIGKNLLPIVAKVAEAVAKLADRFSQLSPRVQKFILIGVGLVAVLGPLLVAVGAVVSAIGAIGLPVAAAIAGIVALGAAVVVAYNKSESFRNVVNQVASALREQLAMAVEFIRSTILPALGQAFEQLRPVLTAWGQFIAVLMQRVGELIQRLAPAWQFMAAVVQYVMPLIQNQIASALRIIQGVIQIFTAVISGNWSSAWTGIKNVFGGIWDGIRGIVTFGVQAIKNSLSSVVSWVGEKFGGLGAVISAPFSAGFGAIKSAWNSTIGGRSITMPDLPGLPGRGQTFRFPTLHKGGIVPGPIGQEVPAILQAGEAVLPIQAVRNLAAERQGGGTTYNITVNAGISDPAEVGRRVVDAVKSYERLNGAGWRAA
jgi:phage-related minor tail protein